MAKRERGGKRKSRNHVVRKTKCEEEEKKTRWEEERK